MVKGQVKRVAVLTSGGDAPGMNAAVRSFVRKALNSEYDVFGIYSGFRGLLDENIKQLDLRKVGQIINLGGTVLKTSRCEEFATTKGLKKAANILNKNKIEALCVIGGDGSFRGLLELAKYYTGQLIGVPGTIDNDIPGTEYTIGFDTAVNTAVVAVDKIRDTAASHGRIFFVEVMGRHSGQIALSVGLACGAEDVLLPETKTDIDKLCQKIQNTKKQGKKFSIFIVAEGDDAGGAFKIAASVKDKINLSARVSVLGHIQRGGAPTAYERVWASRMGDAAVRFIKNGHNLVFTAMKGGNLVPAYLTEAVNGIRNVEPELVNLVRIAGGGS